MQVEEEREKEGQKERGGTSPMPHALIEDQFLWELEVYSKLQIWNTAVSGVFISSRCGKWRERERERERACTSCARARFSLKCARVHLDSQETQIYSQQFCRGRDRRLG